MVPWLSPLLYGVVLVAGGYAAVSGLGEVRVVPFVAGLLLACALDLAHRLHFSHRLPAALLAVRVALYLVVVWADGSGMSRVLFLLLPYFAYVAFGRRVAVVVGVGCLGLVVAVFGVTRPGWTRQVDQVSDLAMFAIGLVLVVAMAAVAVEGQRGVVELAAAAERNRVARDVHDGLGHHLTAVAVLLEKAEAFRDRDPDVVDRALADARESARRALEDVRRSVRTLREPFRLATALEDLTRGLRVTASVEGDEGRYAPSQLLALYRVAQEGVTNALRHASASTVSVSVHCGESEAELVVADDGLGLRGPEGYGLLGMRERVEQEGGVLEVDCSAGTRLTVTIPRRSP
ncbi:sensor histidine kinase [Actinosynnema sp. NPDC020468]|uniref:sensor histidine kinase n=1 Tax=Actinosynnema sp. NPDC020468 TaxID=3154488 RepID=UPI0034020830